MIRETIVPAIPDVRDDNVKDVLRAIKATLDGREGSIGDPLDQGVTLRDLTALNLAVAGGGGTTGTSGGGFLPVVPTLPPVVSNYNPSTDFTVPPAPTGLRARGGFTNVYLEWDGAPYRNHSYTEIWRASVDNLAQAVFVGTTAASLYADPVAPDTTYFYWIRFVSRANVTGPYNRTSGTTATTALDVGSALTALSSEIQSSQLFVDLGTRINRIESDPYIQSVLAGDYNIQISRLSSALDSTNSQITSLRAVNRNNATLITELSTSTQVKNRVFFQNEEPINTPAYMLTQGDIWYDLNNNNKSYRYDGSAWVVMALAVKVYYQDDAPASTLTTPLLLGDLWYDSNDQNKPYRWNGTGWVALRDGYIDARVTTLEQTKIGYATLNATGLVFDNNGAITDKTTTDAWNAANPGNLATWNVGLPFATAVKQVGVTDGVSTLTLEQRFVAQKGTNDQLYGQYTVKIDNNGHVSGFGLASGAVNGTPTSAFIVRADRFAIAGVDDTSDPLGTLAPTRQPFVVTTTPTTINGKTYPAGTWIDTAFIANATITSAQITDLTADKITAGTVSAALGVSTGKLWGGVAVSSAPETFGQLSHPFATANFGTGFFLGNDGGTYKFYVGAPDQNMNWNGSALTVTGNINATSGTFRNITVYDTANNVIMSSGGVPVAAILGLGSLATQNNVSTGQVTGLGALATQNSVDYSGVSGAKPPTDATRNVVTYSATEPSSPAAGDVWVDTSVSPNVIKVRIGSSWFTGANLTTNTNQLVDGAGLGTTANWTQVAGRPTTLAALDATAASDLDGKTVTYYQNDPPSGTVNDLWFDTNDGNKLYRHDGSGWVLVQDAGIAAAAGLATTAQTTANSKITTFYTTSEPTATGVGDLWYNTTTRELRRWNGSAWQTSGNYVDNTNQITDGAGLGLTANWTQVAGRPSTLAALDATAAADLDGKTVTYYQASPPTGTVNDLWFDTDDGNKLYRHDGSNWVAVQDAGIAAAAGLATEAQNTADSKVTTFYTTSTPTATAVGDLWYNTTTRTLSRWNGSAWQTAGNYVDNTNQITDGAGLGTTATWTGVTGTGRPADNATKNTVFRQATAPTGASVNDLWFNTSTAAISYWNGSSWVLAGDVTSQNAAASIIGQGELATANSVFIGSTVRILNQSTGLYEVLNTGDFVNRLAKVNAGTVANFFDAAAIGDAYIGNLNAAKITSGTISAGVLDSVIITSKVANLGSAQLAGVLQSDNFVAGSAGWQIRRDNGSAEFANVKVRGDVQATSLNGIVVNTGNIVGNGVSLVTAAQTSAATLLLSVNIPTGTACVVVLAGLGPGLTTGSGEGGSTYSPSYGDLILDEGTASEATVVSGAAGSLVWSLANPVAGPHTVRVNRSQTMGVLNVSILIFKR